MREDHPDTILKALLPANNIDVFLALIERYGGRRCDHLRTNHRGRQSTSRSGRAWRRDRKGLRRYFRNDRTSGRR